MLEVSYVLPILIEHSPEYQALSATKQLLKLNLEIRTKEILWTLKHYVTGSSRGHEGTPTDDHQTGPS